MKKLFMICGMGIYVGSLPTLQGMIQQKNAQPQPPLELVKYKAPDIKSPSGPKPMDWSPLYSKFNADKTREIFLEITGKLVQFYCCFVKNKNPIMQDNDQLFEWCRMHITNLIRYELIHPIIIGGLFKDGDEKWATNADTSPQALDEFMSSHKTAGIIQEAQVQLGILQEHVKIIKKQAGGRARLLEILAGLNQYLKELIQFLAKEEKKLRARANQAAASVDTLRTPPLPPCIEIELEDTANSLDTQLAQILQSVHLH